MERRLAAIMATDVVGYSRLIRADEEGTIAALKALRADLINPKIDEYHGRIVKLMGDGMLVEFARSYARIWVTRHDQAALVWAVSVTSMPLVNVMPSMTFGN